MSLKWIVALLCSLSVFVNTLCEQPTVQDPVLILNEDQEFAAIQAIHGQLDDNADGSVDLSESSEFVETELCGATLENQQACWSSDKSKRFHQTDKQITSLELWTTWHNNKVINWTTQDVVSWLENTVGLPQYSETFHLYKITGRHLPQIAINTDQILQNLLLITNSKHKQKIQLRAMDVVLFGPPVGSGYWKDALLALSVALSVCGVLYALRQRQVSQSKIDSFLEDFRVKEEELSKLKSKLEIEKTMGETEDHDSRSLDSAPTPPSEEDVALSSVFSSASAHERSDSIVSQIQEENETLRMRILLLEKQITGHSDKMSQLHVLLQDCCRKEWAHLDSKRRAAEDQMSRAQKVCDKIKKRRYSLFGTFHLANSSALEEAGLQITKAVNKMHSISECFDEYHMRWEQIEQVCDFSIVSSSSSPIHRPLPRRDSLQNFRRDDDSSLSLNTVSTLSGQLKRRGSHDSSLSLNTVSTLSGQLKRRGSPECVRQSSVRSTSVSSKSSVEDVTEPRGNAWTQSFAQTESMGESEPDWGLCKPRRNDPSPLHHSISVPTMKRPSLTESLSSTSDSVLADFNEGITFGVAGSVAERKGLDPIREERQRSPAQRRMVSLNKKSKSSEV